ncbi:hypothetical protein TH53_04380 [Pedobacter lusitanus]|uniref:TonB-dependent receptor plug domain-containing protein n=2 Tax=Pedobacter lusitanus TaxID=1503925 RepID=A0A0D0G0E3_9SPHI|nr:hypothetical protein TH53_04380 [Pedobacter lusitanus]
MGYGSYHQKIAVDNQQTLNLSKIILKVNSKDLREVVISAKKKLIVQKPDRIIMNVDQSILAAGNDLFSILAMAPSLQVTNGQVRMLGKSNVLIILDGKRLPGTSLESILSAIPGDLIDRIEIITNPSSKYDANASGGVIEIYTKKKQNSRMVCFCGRKWQCREA